MWVPHLAHPCAFFPISSVSSEHGVGVSGKHEEEAPGGQWDGGTWGGVMGGIQEGNSSVGVSWRGARVGKIGGTGVVWGAVG